MCQYSFSLAYNTTLLVLWRGTAKNKRRWHPLFPAVFCYNSLSCFWLLCNLLLIVLLVPLYFPIFAQSIFSVVAFCLVVPFCSCYFHFFPLLFSPFPSFYFHFCLFAPLSLVFLLSFSAQLLEFYFSKKHLTRLMKVRDNFKHILWDNVFLEEK